MNDEKDRTSAIIPREEEIRQFEREWGIDFDSLADRAGMEVNY